MADKQEFPRLLALDVFFDLFRRFDPEPGWIFEGDKVTQNPHARCERIAFAGSLRRRKEMVGDLEILFIPRFRSEKDPNDFFEGRRHYDDSSRVIEEMLADGTIVKRPKEDGAFTWGSKNRLAVHVATGLPIDFFSATVENWSNYMVCRTGPRQSNEAICNAAIAKGLHWCPYNAGFRQGGNKWKDARTRYVMKSEREVFEFVVMEYKEPWDRL